MSISCVYSADELLYEEKSFVDCIRFCAASASNREHLRGTTTYSISFEAIIKKWGYWWEARCHHKAWIIKPPVKTRENWSFLLNESISKTSTATICFSSSQNASFYVSPTNLWFKRDSVLSKWGHRTHRTTSIQLLAMWAAQCRSVRTPTAVWVIF